MKLIAFVDVETVDNKTIVKSVSPFDPKVIDAETFSADWMDGQQARQKWEQFCNAFFNLLMESGFVDKTGLHVDEYTAGSVFRFLKKNPGILPESFRDSVVGAMVMQAIKSGAKMLKTGKDIEINWASINQHTGPMTEAVLSRLIIDPGRKEVLQPLFDQYLTLPADSTPATDTE